MANMTKRLKKIINQKLNPLFEYITLQNLHHSFNSHKSTIYKL